MPSGVLAVKIGVPLVGEGRNGFTTRSSGGQFQRIVNMGIRRRLAWHTKYGVNFDTRALILADRSHARTQASNHFGCISGNNMPSEALTVHHLDCDLVETETSFVGEASSPKDNGPVNMKI